MRKTPPSAPGGIMAESEVEPVVDWRIQESSQRTQIVESARESGGRSPTEKEQK